MTYDEFERRLLRIVFEEKKESLTPSFLAYKLQIPHTLVKEHLDQALENGIVELKIDDDGKFNYTVPGFDPNASTVRKRVTQSEANSKETSFTPTSYSRHEDPDEEARREVDEIAPVAPLPKDEKPQEISGLPAIVDDATGLEKRRKGIYIRKIHVFGDYSKFELSARIAAILQTLSYETVEDKSHRLEPENDLYKRGSFMFILFLLPFFILVLPLLIYIILQATGHSMIRNEPTYLEVGIKRLEKDQIAFWEVTFVYRGLHGVVFSFSDKDLIDREVAAIESELKK